METIETNSDPFSKSTKSNLTLIIPCFNESERLPIFLETLSKDIPESITIIIVDDGSSLKEYNILHNRIFSFLNESIHLIHYERNLGKFSAIEFGIQKSTTDYIGFVDSDGSVPSHEIVQFWKYIQKFPDVDLLISARKKSIGKYVYFSKLRLISHKLFNYYVKILFKININDTQCGMKILKRSLHEKVNQFMLNKRWIWDTELIILCHKMNQKYVEIGIDWNEKRGSKFHLLKDSITTFIDLFQFKQHLKKLSL